LFIVFDNLCGVVFPARAFFGGFAAGAWRFFLLGNAAVAIRPEDRGKVGSVAGHGVLFVVGLQGVKAFVDEYFQMLLAFQAGVKFDQIERGDVLAAGFFLPELAIRDGDLVDHRALSR
jgi:hypothetical protein